MSALLTGCGDGRIEASPGASCQVMDSSGKVINPTSYREGSVDVEYQEARTAFNEVEKTDGEIVKASGDYVLKLASLPEHLSNGYILDFSETDAVVIISQPELGRIGLTPSCINRDENEFGIPSVQVELPTQDTN